MTDTPERFVALKQMLTNRRRELQDDMQRRIRDGRTDHTTGVRDHYELSDDDIQEDIELALLQLKSETMMCIDQALARLERGKYGSCLECDDEISERRLRALPFAVRCQSCEETREQNGDTAHGATRRRGTSLFPDATT